MRMPNTYNSTRQTRAGTHTRNCFEQSAVPDDLEGSAMPPSEMLVTQVSHHSFAANFDWEARHSLSRNRD
jgi:hypothetical protein